MLTGTRKLQAVAVFTILLIGLVNMAWWVYYSRTEAMMEYQLGRRLTAVANGAAVTILPDQIDNLLADDLNAFIEISATLENIRAADSLSELFIVDPNYRVWATTSLQSDSTYFLVDLNGQYIDSLVFSDNPVAIATPSYRTGDLYLKSAFAPIYDNTGFVAAVVGVEASVDYFEALTDLRSNLYYSTLLSLGAGLIFGIIFFLFQRQINRAEQQLFLSQTNSFLGRMVAVVSHEIKNPLMIIRASAERLIRKSPSKESQFIVEEVDRLNQIVTGYLSFARSGESMTRLDSLEQTNLSEVITNIRQHFQSKYPNESITWLDGNLPAEMIIRTYPRSLRQVLLNLLINGADACLENSKPIKVGVSLDSKEDDVRIIVTDHGPGLTKKEIKKIFTPFYSTKQTGSGLGLFLSRKIITDMGGELSLTSRIGESTAFVISLPKEPKS